ncbi:hypothetical protein BD626DRAFT_410188 [Schizophyllum amplum]|uniref:Uncharacterized protein n=1 Tax=Schizophyllum amplum TaxID=97359 RepID=A0A550C1B8_9AGAR|nr:hypothetical protein BD626DRAFT_410188 [Auriculariopsis ampla]
MSPRKVCCSADSEITVLFVRPKKRWQPTDFINQVCRGHAIRYLRHADIDFRSVDSPRKLWCYSEYSTLPRVQKLLPQLEKREFHAIVFEGAAAVDYCQSLCSSPPLRLRERYDLLGSSPSEFDALEDIHIFFNSLAVHPNCPIWLLKLYCRHRPEDIPPSCRIPEIKYGMRERELLSTMPSLGYQSKRPALERASPSSRQLTDTLNGLLFWRKSTIVDDEPPNPLTVRRSDVDDE